MRWIIGDIHGMLLPLRALLDTISQKDPEAQLLFVGDYVNRGPESREVIDQLLTLPNARFIRGNHDDIFDHVLHGRCYAQNATNGNRLLAFQWFMQHGLDSTLTSYGVDWAELDHLRSHSTDQKLDSALSCVPSSHRQFIRSLPAVIEEPDLFVAHGWWNPDDSAESPSIVEQLLTDAQRRHLLLWGRFSDEQITRQKRWGRVGYFGHTPVENYPALLGNRDPVPLRGPNLVLLDTAAALSPNGRLTAFCHETRSCLQADRQGQIVRSTSAC